MNEIAEKVKTIVEPLLKEKGYDIYVIEYQKEGANWILRLFTDNQTRSINLDQCADVSRIVDEALENNPDLIPVVFSLEVSSPGLDRLLKSEADFLCRP